MTDIEKIVKIIENYSPELAAEEILLLFNVSNRRELLIGFIEDIKKHPRTMFFDNDTIVDEFLANL